MSLNAIGIKFCLTDDPAYHALADFSMLYGVTQLPAREIGETNTL